MNSSEINRLSRYQRQDGAFRSRVTGKRFCDDDYNGCITGLTIRSLRLQGLVDLPCIDRALGFLEGCSSTHVPGAYRFWPENRHPAWCPSLPDDADDTAIIALELYLAGRVDHTILKEMVCRVLLPHRVRQTDSPQPPWIRHGAFYTWLGRRKPRRNIVDCCVNVNVIALLKALELTHLPGYGEAIATIKAGLHRVFKEGGRFVEIAPYYPNPFELHAALENAHRMGVTALESERQALWTWLQHTKDSTIVCSNVYGSGFTWTSEALTLSRSISGVPC